MRTVATRRLLPAVFTVLAVVVGMTLGALAAEAPKYGGIWKDALNSNPPHLDPVFATDTTSAEADYQLFETLLEYDPDDGSLKPLLAESVDVSPDGKVFTFHLRQGVHFHATTEGGKPTANGGREVTADDWVWTLNYITNPEVNSPRAYFIDMVKGYKAYHDDKTADSLEGVRALDKYTLQIELEYPFTPFLGIIAYNTFVVLPREDVEKWGKDGFNFHPVGTGAFKFEKWLQDDRLILSRNENYWMKDAQGNQLPYLDGIEYRIITDYSIEWTEYKLGNLYASYVDDPYYREAKSGAVGQFLEKPQPGTYYYGMNVTLQPFTDKRVRQALNYAINREALIRLILNGRASPAKGVLPPGFPAYNPNLKGYNYDPARARRLLAEAGYGPNNPLKVTLQYNTSAGHKRIGEALQAQMAAVGVQVSLKEIDWGSHLDSVERGEVAFFRMGWVVDYMDPDNFLYVLLNSANFGPQGNYTRFSDPEFDRLTNAARVEPDQAKREQMYQKAEQIVVEEAPWLFIYHYTSHILLKDFVRGYKLPAFGQYSNKFRDVWLAK